MNGLRRAAPWLLLALICLIPRVMHLRSQIPLDDEHHLLFAVVRNSYAETLTSSPQSGNSIPLTLLVKALADTVGLDEVTLRLPVLAAGVATVLLVARYGSATLGSPWLLGALLALSPPLVFYSRYARPAGLVALLAPVAVLALLRWTRTRARGDLAVYLGAAIAGVYVHPLSAPLVAAPAACAALDRGAAPEVRRVARRGLLVLAAASALLLAPPWILGGGLQPVSEQSPAFAASSLTGMGPYLFGTTDGTIHLAVLAIAVLGAVALHRQDRQFVLYVGIAMAAQLVAVVSIGTDRGNSLALFRNLIGALPLLLLFVARGIALLVARAPLRQVLAAALVAALFLTGFLPPHLTARADSFLVNKVLFFVPNRHDPFRPHPFYERLAERDDGSAVLEVPFDLRADPSRLPLYQRVHGRDVRVSWRSSNLRPLLKRWLQAGESARFRTIVDEQGDLAAAGIGIVIIHKWECPDGIPDIAGDVILDDAELRVIVPPPAGSARASTPATGPRRQR